MLSSHLNSGTVIVTSELIHKQGCMWYSENGRRMMSKIAVMIGAGVLSVLICFAVSFVVAGCSDGSSNASKPPGVDPVPTIASEVGELADNSPSDPSAIKPMKVKSEKVLDYNVRVNVKERTWDFGGAGLAGDTPRLELRFYSGDKAGRKPTTVDWIIVQNQAPSLGPGREITAGVKFKCSKTGVRGAKVARFPIVSLPNDAQHEAFIFGRKYLIEFHLSEESRESSGSVMIMAPKEMKPGTVAVYEIDVDKHHPNTGRKVPHKVLLTFDTGAVKFPVNVHFHDMDSGRTRFVSIKAGPKGTFPLHAFGGELAVVEKSAKYARFYVKTLGKGPLHFPKDADLAVTDENRISFLVRLPKEGLPEKIRMFWLMVDTNDRSPVAWAEGPLRNEKPLGETIGLTYIPGTYFLTVAVDLSNEPKLIGKVTITKESAGKTVEVQPILKK